MTTTTIRTRIAPSPTGEPHVGTAYIALFNLCFARRHGGQFILRIEDTDQARKSEASERDILESLAWLGLNWDEGPDIGGSFGPYRQSERLALYRDQVQILLDRGHAYPCFCTPDDLEALRRSQTAAKQPPGYFGAASTCRHLSREEATSRIRSGTPHVIRMAVPIGEDTLEFYDGIRKGGISRRLGEIDDQVLVKSDGFPTYHLASVVDDHFMQISHVFRGEEWINSTYKHVLLYRFFGWEAPLFFHLGLLRNPDANKSKISKRKNPVSLRWFRAAGYRPEALVNFLGLMGYSRYREGMSLEEQKTCEIYDVSAMISDFDIARISPTGAAFDFVKLEDINFQYMSLLSPDAFFEHLVERTRYLKQYLEGYHDLFLTRYQRAEKEITFWTAFLFKHRLDYAAHSFNKVSLEPQTRMAEVLLGYRKLLRTEADNLNTVDSLKDFTEKCTATLEVDRSALLMLLRVAITGSPESLPLYQSMLLLGIYRCLTRLEEAAAFLKRSSR